MKSQYSVSPTHDGAATHSPSAQGAYVACQPTPSWKSPCDLSAASRNARLPDAYASAAGTFSRAAMAATW